MKVGVIGWVGTYEAGAPLCGVHDTAEIGGPPEHPGWQPGDPVLSPVIDPTCQINAFCTIDGGMATHAPTRVGPRAFLQAHVHIGHNAVVEEGARVCVGSVICGHVKIGRNASISGNTWIRPWVTVHEGAIVGGGSVVTKDIPAYEVWCGNPARFLKFADKHPGVAPKGGRDIEEIHVENFDHPYRDPDYVWDFMRPWHHRSTT